MVRVTKKGGEVEPIRIKPDSPSVMYVTVSVEDEFRMITQNWKMQEEEKKRASKVNVFKKSTRVTKCGRSFEKIFSATANLPSDTNTSDYPSDNLLQLPFSLSANTSKDAFIISEGRSVSCPTKMNKQSRKRLCRSEGGASWEAVRVFIENAILLDIW